MTTAPGNQTPTTTVHLPPTRPPRRRWRVPLLVLAIGALVVGGIVAAAVAIVGAGAGVATAVSLKTETTTETFTGVREITVDVDEGHVAFTAATGADVEVVTTRTSQPDYAPLTSRRVDGGVLTAIGDCPDLNFGCETEYRIAVPAGTVVHARTVSGAVEATGIDAARFSADTVAGAVSASLVRVPDEVRIETVNGSVRLEVPQHAYRVSADSSVGAVHVGVPDEPSATARIDVDTVAGAIDITAR